MSLHQLILPATAGAAVLALLAVPVVAQEGAPETAASPASPAPQATVLGVQEEAEAIGAPAGAPRDGAELERAADSLSSEMRCPVCQGLSIADSPSDMARDMRSKVRALLAEGYSPEQVMEYFESTYGEFVRLEPKPEGFNLVVWIAPIAVLALGLGLTAYILRQRAHQGASVGTSGEDELDALRERVRREVG
jgi:cytochrome c-type biogenesis protein CcmH/NrfF